MENIFNIIAYRFHTKDDGQLLIIGYFNENDMNDQCPVIKLEDNQLKYTAEERILASHMFRTVGDKKITKEYYLWLQLPKDWEEHQKLSIYNQVDGSEKLLINIPKEDLLKVRDRIHGNIDSAYADDKGFSAVGWYINTDNTKVRFFDMKGNELKLTLSHMQRRDVRRAYPENTENEIISFRAQYQGDVPEKIRIEFERNENKIEQVLRLKNPPVKEAMIRSRKMLFKAYDFYRQFGVRASLRRTVDKIEQREYTDYEQWRMLRQPSKGVLKKQRRKHFRYMPKISIVVPLYRTPDIFLDELIASVKNQSYKKWELCLSDGSGKDSPLTQKLKEYERKDKRIRVVHNEKQLHISANTNEALKICTGDYIAFADHDDVLTPDALYECVAAINENPKIELIYSDEDKINMDGTEYFQPHFKSDFNLDMLRCTNYFCHLVVVKRGLYEKVGLLNPVCDGAQDYDFVLRCLEKTSQIKHIQKVLYHWRAHKDSTAENPESKSYVTEAGIHALKSHYERLGIDASIFPTEYLGIYRTKFALKEKPLVSVIIPNKDHKEDLEKCIRSLDEVNNYHNIEYIIVENNSTEDETFAYYKELEAKNERAKVVYWKGKGFNYPAINTYGVQYAKGEYLLFLNNDTEILNEDCIEELLSYCVREDVGAVGARMYYEDGTIQHAGVIVGAGGVAAHAFLNLPHDTPGYFGRAIMAQDLSAVTAACVMIPRKVYEEVGGFDEAYAVAFNDVDLCMKIRKAGYLVVYNPQAELMHYESKSRGYEDTEEKQLRFESEIRLFRSRWIDFLEAGDPYYNPNLTLDRNDFSLNMTMKR